jgi:tetratricopeptide (TPR) repeat protein
MRTAALTLLLLVLTAGSAPGESGAAIPEALKQLESPYLEVRRHAARDLAGRGGDAAEALRARYARSDYRTKILVLEAFAATRPVDGLPLVYQDLASPDRGVVLAQRRLVSAVYARPRVLVADEIAERLKPTEWQLEEHLRALPGPGPSPREALAKSRLSERGWLFPRAHRLAGLVAEVDGMRAALGRAGEEGSAVEKTRAAQMLVHVLRHDVERAFNAVLEAGGLSGHYDGMFATLKEVVTRPEGKRGLELLLAAAKDEAPSEGDVPGGRRERYEFLEPALPYMSGPVRRIEVLNALGDVGDEAVARALTEYFRTFLRPERDRSTEKWTQVLDLDDPTSDTAALAVGVAQACVGLGENGPMEMVVATLDKIVDRRPWSTEQRGRLAAAYSRIGRLQEAVDQYRLCLEFDPSRTSILRYNLACTLSRLGRVDEALRELKLSVRDGYARYAPSEAVWMDRDGDLAPVRETEGYLELREALLPR